MAQETQWRGYRPRPYKLCVGGCGGVGRTALADRFAFHRFSYAPTTKEIETYYRRKIIIDDESAILDIPNTFWPHRGDMGGYYGLHDVHIYRAVGFLLVYSIDSRRTFDEIEGLYRIIFRNKDENAFPVVLVGNKCDKPLDERQVSTEEGICLARSLGCPFFETSAKDNTNVDEAFSELVREVRRYDKEQVTALAYGDQLEDLPASGCCARCVIV